MKPSALKATLVLVIGAIFGWALWQFSEMITGKDEPWDDHGFYYYGGLFFSGFLASLVSPRHFYLAPIGLVFGQFLYLIDYLGPIPFYLLGTLYLLFFSLIGLAGAATCLGLHKWLHRKKPEEKSR